MRGEWIKKIKKVICVSWITVAVVCQIKGTIDFGRKCKAASNSETDTEEENWIISRMSRMSIEEKVAQLFVITPEALTGVGPVTEAGELTRERFLQYPVGGVIYFTENILSEEQLVRMLNTMQEYSYEQLNLPVFTCIDEEGGEVTRISGKGVIDVPYIESMQEVGRGEPEDACYVGTEIGEYLKRLSFLVDFAPVADVTGNKENSVIGSRAFGSDPKRTADFIAEFVKGMHTQKMATAVKHFPGHGNTGEDSHTSFAVSYRTLDEIRESELIPFQAGIEAGSDFVMVGHISMPNITGNELPATLSPQIITDLLREEMGYKGIVITDAMNMGAIANYYRSDEAAVKAIQAGADMILMPYDFTSAYEGVLSAVEQGEISGERLDESLERILKLKYKIENAG